MKIILDTNFLVSAARNTNSNMMWLDFSLSIEGGRLDF